MTKAQRIVRVGMFNHDELTVSFGGEFSKPHNIFTAKAIKVPDYKYTVRERESLGGGWYGGMEVNEYTDDNLYVVIREGICIGQMHPYAKGHNIKSQLVECGEEALKFLRKNNIDYKP